MNVTDPIADLLTRLRNGQKAGHAVVCIPASKLKIAIVHILKKEGFIKAFKCVRDSKQGLIKVALKYKDAHNRVGVFQALQRISKPGRRSYVRASAVPYVKNGFGLAILSTSSGVITCRDARERGLGGELLCSVY